MSDTKPSFADTDTPHLVLIGHGDAHFHVAARTEHLRQAGAQVTLITREDFTFSDWLGGMLGGEWQLDDVRLPAERIAAHGGTHLAAEVTSVDHPARQLLLDNGRRLDYDWLSIDLPPVVDQHAIPGFYTARGVYGVSANDLWQLRQRLETQLASGTAHLPNVAVIGSGPLGVELAANLLALGERYGKRLPVTLVDNDRRPLPGACQRANRWLTQRLHRRGLRLELVATATRYDHGQLILDDGSAVDADFLLVTDALRSLPDPSRFGLATADTEQTDTEASQRFPEAPHLFVSRHLPDRALSARERGALLLAALEQAINGEARQSSHAHALHWTALNLGDLRDIAWRGSLWCRGRWVRRLKHRRDHREVAHYLGNT